MNARPDVAAQSSGSPTDPFAFLMSFQKPSYAALNELALESTQIKNPFTKPEFILYFV